MPTCEDCISHKDKVHRTGYGVYPSTCVKLKIGIRPDSDICDKFDGDNTVIINEHNEKGGTRESERFE